MATPSFNQMYPQNISRSTGVLNYASGVGGTLATITPTSTNNIGQKIESLGVVNTDSVAYTGTLYITNGGTNYPQGQFSIPANVGNLPTEAPLALLGSVGLGIQPTFPQFPQDPNGNQYIWLGPGDSLTYSLNNRVTNTAGIEVAITGMGGIY